MGFTKLQYVNYVNYAIASQLKLGNQYISPRLSMFSSCNKKLPRLSFYSKVRNSFQKR